MAILLFMLSYVNGTNDPKYISFINQNCDNESFTKIMTEKMKQDAELHIKGHIHVGIGVHGNVRIL